MSAAPILFVDHAQARGGAQNCLLLLLEEIDRERFTPHLATQPGHLADAARALGVSVHQVPLRKLRGAAAGPWHLARATVRLTRLIRRQGIALVHANSLRASAYAGPAAFLTRRPLVWHVHDVLSPSPYVRWLARRCRSAIAVSQAVAAPLPCGDKVRVIHNGVRAGDFAGDRRPQAARLRQTWGIPAGAVLIGQVARLQPWKGQRDVIAAAERLRDLDRVHIAIIGGDIFDDAVGYERELKTTVRSRGLGDRVVFTGHQDDMPAVLSAVDILVHASDNEPFGRVLIEAAAAGVPVVAYASGAVPEIITHEQTGLLVPSGDVGALSAALRQLATTPGLAQRLADNAGREVRNRFDSEQVTRAIERVLASLLARSPSLPGRRR